MDKSVKNLQLQPGSTGDKVEVVYSHCGQIGKNRSITIKDDNNKALKTWEFTDAAGSAKAMTCSLSDLVMLQKENKLSKLNLYYSSKELPRGKLLATISAGNFAASGVVGKAVSGI